MSIHIALVSVAGEPGRRSENSALLAERVIQDPGTYQLQTEEPCTTIAVAAGVWPHDLGARASHLTLKLLAHRLGEDPELSERSIRAVQRTMGDRAYRKRYIGMRTTLAALQVRGDTATIVNVGDSPVYLWRDGFLHQESVDHTTLRRMLAEGIITEADEAAAAGQFDNLDSSLYADPYADQFEVHESKIATRPGDLWLLCSRGLSKSLASPQIAEIVSQVHRDGPGAVAQCLAAAPAISEATDVDATVAALRIG